VELETLPLPPSVGNVEARICDGKDENWYVNFCVSLLVCRKIVVFWVPKNFFYWYSKME